MIFMTYWELDPSFDPSELADVAQKILNKKLYPTEGVKQLAWYISTTDYWGISIDEAQTEEQLIKDISVWRIAKPGLFKKTKITPAAEITKVIPIMMKLKKQLE